jgi:hypothetical protein
MRTRSIPVVVTAALLTAVLAACGTGAHAPAVRPAAAATASATALSVPALRSWWTAVQPDVVKLADDLATGGTDPAAVTAYQADVSALQADPGFPSGDPGAADAWRTALADYASALADLQRGDSVDALALLDSGTAAVNRVMQDITDLGN